MEALLDQFNGEDVLGLLLDINRLYRGVPSGQDLLLLAFRGDDRHIKSAKEILEALKENGAVKNISYSNSPVQSATFQINPDLCAALLKQYKRAMVSAVINSFGALDDFAVEKRGVESIKIKNIRLDEKKRMLVINNGQENFMFNASGDSDSSKAFKIILALWEKRHEMRGGAITTKQHDNMSEENLLRSSGVLTVPALKRQIDRLNQRFKEKGLAIAIVNKGGQCKLVIKCV